MKSSSTTSSSHHGLKHLYEVGHPSGNHDKHVRQSKHYRQALDLNALPGLNHAWDPDYSAHSIVNDLAKTCWRYSSQVLRVTWG